MPHALAACLVVLLEASHEPDPVREAELISKVESAVSILQKTAASSRIAHNATGVLTSALEARRAPVTNQADGTTAFERELHRAIFRLQGPYRRRQSSFAFHTNDGAANNPANSQTAVDATDLSSARAGGLDAQMEEFQDWLDAPPQSEEWMSLFLTGDVEPFASGA